GPTPLPTPPLRTRRAAEWAIDWDGVLPDSETGTLIGFPDFFSLVPSLCPRRKSARVIGTGKSIKQGMCSRQLCRRLRLLAGTLDSHIDGEVVDSPGDTAFGLCHANLHQVRPVQPS